MFRKPRLRTILLIINLVILLLPLLGIGVLRIYESELVRRTESELIAQGTIIGAAFKKELQNSLCPSSYGASATYKPPAQYHYASKYKYIGPKLDIYAETIRPPALPASAPDIAPDKYARLAANRVDALLAASKEVTLVGIRLVDYRGTVISSTGSEMGMSLISREEVRRSLAGEYVSLLRQRISDDPQPPSTSLSRGKRLRVFVAMPIIENNMVLGAVILSRTPLDIRKSLYMIRGQLAAAAAGLVTVVFGITLLTSITVNRPLTSLAKYAQSVVAGDKSEAPPISHSGIYEITVLSQAVTSMSRTLEDRAEYIRTFAANVSHEFKTPLTSIRATVELLEEHFFEMSDEERKRFLHIISSDTERLDRLVRRLLDLARADTLRPSDVQCNTSEVLNSLVQQFLTQGLKVHLAAAIPAVRINMTREVFESIVSNLIENARQHSGNDVEISISGRILQSQETTLEIDVHDNGPGIPEANREKIFRPFFTTARENGGSGLGLSIVKSLLIAHGGLISLEPSPGGSLFRLRIPAQRA